MSNLIKHAKQEFLRAGYLPVEECEDGPNKWIQKNVLELLKVFAEQGHSGMSAPYAINLFTKLANFDLISPLKEADCVFGENGQCGQLSSLFRKKEGKPYYLDAIAFKEASGACFTGSSVDLKDGTAIGSPQYVKFPFVPKTFYIDVLSTEWADREGTTQKEGGGWWTHVVKDEAQLKEVFEYYDRKEQVDGSKT